MAGGGGEDWDEEGGGNIEQELFLNLSRTFEKDCTTISPSLHTRMPQQVGCWYKRMYSVHVLYIIS